MEKSKLPAIWKCKYCGQESEIEMKDILFLQYGDRMAGGYYTYCNSERCENELSEIDPINPEAKKIFKNKYEKTSIRCGGSTWDIGNRIPKIKK